MKVSTNSITTTAQAHDVVSGPAARQQSDEVENPAALTGEMPSGASDSAKSISGQMLPIDNDMQEAS